MGTLFAAAGGVGGLGGGVICGSSHYAAELVGQTNRDRLIMSWQSVDGIGCCPATGKSASAPAPSGNPAEARSPVEKFKLVLKSGDNLPLATGLRCRVRSFTAGADLGSEAFAETRPAAYRLKSGCSERMAHDRSQRWRNGAGW